MTGIPQPGPQAAATAVARAGFALLCGYAAIFIGAGAWRLPRSDA